MPTVLVPTDNPMLIPGLTAGYASNGWDVIVGKANFFNMAHRADMLHCHWPEEFSDWRLPSTRQMDRIRDALQWWSNRCPAVISVHNLYPHGFEGNPTYRKLYDIFYERCRVILHHNEKLRRLVLDEFPSARRQNNVTTTYFNNDHLLPAKLDREACRRSFGFQPEDFVVLVFGMLRSWNEVALIHRAYALAKIPRKRLLMAGRYHEPMNRVKRRVRNLQMKLWARSAGAIVSQGYIEDEEVHRYVEACDALLVPRIRDMNSGLLCLGLTFGRALVAPSHAAYAEQLEGTTNFFYDSGDARSMAGAIERASAADRDLIARQNRALADRWSWSGIACAAIDAAGLTAAVTNS